jgi:hypothetical protein
MPKIRIYKNEGFKTALSLGFCEDCLADAIKGFSIFFINSSTAQRKKRQ